MLTGIEVDPDGPACPNFTPKTMAETSRPVKPSYGEGQPYIGLGHGRGGFSGGQGAGRGMGRRRGMSMASGAGTYPIRTPLQPPTATTREQEIEALKKQLEETERQLVEVKRRLEELRR